MRISNCVKNEDETYDFDFNVNQEEAGFLMDYAIKSFIHFGIVKVAEGELEQQLDLFPETEGEMQ